MANNTDKIFRIVVDYQTADQNLRKVQSELENVNKQTKALLKTQVDLEKQGRRDSVTYKQNEKDLIKLRQEQAVLNQQKQKAVSNARAVSKELAAEANSVNELRTRLSRLKTEWAAADRGTNTFKTLTRELRSTEKELRKVEKQVGVFGRNVGNYFSAMLKGFVGGNIMLSAVNSVRKGFRQIVKYIKDFEQANANLASILRTSVGEITDLTESAMELGRTTEWSASQVTMLQTELAKLGVGKSDIMEMQAAILQFATATGAELPNAAALAGAALRMFGGDTQETARYVSAMAVSTTRSALNFGYLETALSTVGPVANAFGFTIEDTVALLGTLADAGFDASAAATATRNILLKLADASGDLAQELEGPVKTIPELSQALITLRDKGVDLATALELTDKRSVAAFNTFLSGAEKIDTLRASITGVEAEMKQMQETRLDTLQGSLKLLRSAWEGFALSMRKSSDAMKGAVDVLTYLVNNLDSVLKTLVAYIATVKLIKLGIVIRNTHLLTAAMALLTGRVKQATVAIKGMSAALKTSLIGLMVAAITAIISFSSKTSEAAEAMAELNAEISKERDGLAKTAYEVQRAAEGTQERADAIKQINERYGEYLPNLLTEKSSNEEVAAALKTVNAALEENIRIKYKKAAADKIEANLQKKYDKALKYVLKGAAAKTPAAVANVSAAFAELTEKIKEAGVEASRDDINNFLDQFKINGLRALDILTPLIRGVENYRDEMAELNELFPAPIPVASGGITKKNADPKGETPEQVRVRLAKLSIEELDRLISESDDKEEKKIALRVLREKKAAEKIVKEEEKAAEKIVKEKEKAAKDAEKIETERAKRQIELQREITQSEIDAMSEGLAKRLSQQDFNSQKELERIEKEYKDFGEYEQLKTQTVQNQLDKRREIIGKATDEEFEEYISTLGTIAEKVIATSARITENEKKEADKRKKQLETIQSTTTKGTTDADSRYKAQKEYIDAVITDEKKANALRRQNEVTYRQELINTYQTQLQNLIAIGAIDDEQYNDVMAKLKAVGAEAQNIAKGIGVGADGSYTGNSADNGGKKKKSLWRSLLGLPQEGDDERTDGEKWEAVVEEVKGKAWEMVNQVTSIMEQSEKASIDRRLQAELKKINDVADSEKRALDERKRRGLISEKSYQKELEKIDAAAEKKREEAEKKAFKKKQDVDVKYTLINTAVGIGKTIAINGFPAAIPYIAMAAIEGALQVAAIKSQKYKQGGIMPIGDGVKAGIVQGPSHSAGGVRIYAEGSNTPLGEVEGGEMIAVVNKRSTSAIKRLSDINQAGGGRKFAQGGIMGSPGGWATSWNIPSPAPVPNYQADVQKQIATYQYDMQSLRSDLTESINAMRSYVANIKVSVVESEMTAAQNSVKATVVQSEIG